MRGSNRPGGERGRPTGAVEADPAAVDCLEAALSYARDRDYTGWDFADGLSSRLLRALPVESRVLNLAVQELAKRAPVNVRPLLAVEQRRNHMGAALFAMTNQTLASLADAGHVEVTDRDYRGETRRLLDWLVERGAEGYAGYGVGHSHRVQGLEGCSSANVPGSVCTAVAVKALLRGADLDDRYATVAESAADFVVEDLDYRETTAGARITYNENYDGSHYTLNAGAMAARLFVDLYDHVGDPGYRRRARELLDHLAARQQPRGGWYYRDPPSASHLSMDTHHNGFVVESFQRYAAATGEDRYGDVLDRALAFFERDLFAADGAPNFDERSPYPRDVHASAQGILVFTYAGDLPAARRVLRWTVRNLGAGDGRFYFRKHRFHTKRTVLMRWCQAWMAFAVAEYLRAVHGEDPVATV